jgi:hypothetical protein
MKNRLQRIGGKLFLAGAALLATAVLHAQLRVQFAFRCGDYLLQPGEVYHNAFGEPFRINRFNFYVSNITARNGATRTPASRPPHLVRWEDSATWHVTLPVAACTDISFTLGVDSLYNIKGVQTGDLDPYLGMFWTWNSGYVFAKLEGNSDSAATPSHIFSQHIGGYKAGEQAQRTIRLPVAPGAVRNGSLTILVDVQHWFNGRHPLSIARHPVCHVPGALALQYADNYATLFRVQNPTP